MYMDSVYGEGAVQKEEDVTSHPQRVLCREFKSHQVHLLTFSALHVIYIT